tara:strand:- start:3026 stop:3484 length:459 start_codon:yes stop_codon:yes gene_type:complete
MSSVEFAHPGEPISKSNAYKRGRGKSFYKDAKYVEYEETLQQAAIEAMGDNPPFEGPCHITLRFYFKTYRRKDLTNMPKTACDALNDIVYLDDTQIVSAELEKLYDKENPRVEIIVEELPDDPAYPLTRCKPKKRPRVRKSVRKTAVVPTDR